MTFHNEYFVLHDMACAGLAPPLWAYLYQFLLVGFLFVVSVSLPVAVGIAIIKEKRTKKESVMDD